MSWWPPRRRAHNENIEAHAETMTRDFGFAAYHQARRMANEAGSRATASEWCQVALAIAQKTGRRINADASRRLARGAIFAIA
jgi:hypothetical protein